MKKQNIVPHRIAWIDVLKGITILLVAIHHGVLMAYSLAIESSCPLFDSFVMEIDSWLEYSRMSSFFLASGLVMASLKRNKPEWFLTKRMPFMIWIVFIWTFISFSVEKFGLHLYPWTSFPFPIGKLFLTPYGNLWFIYALLLLSGLAAAVSNFGRFYQVLLTVILSVGFHYALNHFEFNYTNKLLLRNLSYKGLPFFMAGFIFKKQILCFFKKKFVLLLSIIFVSIFAFISKSILNELHAYGLLFFRYIPMTFVFVGIIVLMSYFSRFRQFFSHFGLFSLEIFVLHQFFVASVFSFYRIAFLNGGYIFDKLFLIFSPIVFCLVFVTNLNNLIKPLFFSIPKPILSIGTFLKSS